MPSLAKPILLPPRNESAVSLGGDLGSASEPWSVGYFLALYQNGVAVAPIVSPTFTGTPRVPTASALTGGTVAASCGYADAAVSAGATAVVSLTRGGMGINLAASSGLLYVTGGVGSVKTATAAGLAILDDADDTAQRVTLGLVIGTNVQAYHASLAALAGLSLTKGNLPIFNGTVLGALGVGTNDHVLTADSAQTYGVKWAAPAGVLTNGTTPITSFQELAGLNFTDATELTIGTGVVTVTQTLHTLDTEGDAASDILTTISGGAIGNIVIFRLQNTGRTVTFDHAADNIRCMGDADFTLTTDDDRAWCEREGSNWYCHLMGRGVGSLLATGTVAGTGRQELLRLNLTDATELTIAAGVVTATQGVHTIDTESDAATDDLDTISGGVQGDRLIIYAADAARTVVVKHATGNILTPDGNSILLDESRRTIELLHDGTNWRVIAPPQWVAFTVPIGDDSTAISSGTAKKTFRMPFAMTLTDLRASCKTAPATQAIIIDINETATTILSTKLTIDATEKTSTTAATPHVISDSALADDAEITIDFDQVGAGTTGAGVHVTFYGYRA